MDKRTIFLKTPGVVWTTNTKEVGSTVKRLESEGRMIYEITSEEDGYCIKHALGFYSEDELLLRKIK